MEYINAQEIILSVKNWLRPYFQAGAVDESILIEEILPQLAEIGCKILPRKTVTVEVKNHKATLPPDFHKLILAVSCTTHELIVQDPISMTSYEKYVCDIPACKSETDYCSDCNGNLYQIYQRYNTHVYRHSNIQPLIVSKEASNYCDSDCLNPKANQFDITIKKGVIHTQFCDGTVYIEYKSKLEEDGMLVVPDDEYIKKFLRDWLIWTALTYIQYNSPDANVERRVAMARDNAYMSKENARTYWKRNGVRDYYKLREILVNRFVSMTSNIPNALIKNTKPSRGIR